MIENPKFKPAATRIIAIVALILSIAGPIVAVLTSEQAPAAPIAVPLPTTHLTDLLLSGVVTADDLTAVDDVTAGDDVISTDDVTAGDDLISTDDVTAGDDLAVTDDTTLSGLLNLGATTLTVADASTITPASSFYHLDSAGAVGTTLAACSVDGQLLVLFGDDANNITIADTNVRTSTGNAVVMGQYDVTVWICETTEWIQLLLIADS
jgi:hypothetical protein